MSYKIYTKENYYDVYYKKGGIEIEDRISPNTMTKEYFDKNYRLVVSVITDNLERVYNNMQGENWSPNGEARDLILFLGLSHTSMSIGDIIFCYDDQKYYWCSWLGFDEVAITN